MRHFVDLGRMGAAAARWLLAWVVGLVLWARVAWGAYTITGTTAPLTSVGGREQWEVTITETGIRDTSETPIVGVPVCGTITVLRAKLTSGTGTTIRPRIGYAAGFAASGYDEIGVASTTAAQLSEPASAPYCTSTRTLYLRSAPNSTATDHAVTTKIVIVSGAQQ